MPRGGARVGAGRKPKARKAVVLGMDGQRLLGEPGSPGSPWVAPVVGDDPLLAPPADLPPAQQDFWRIYAPYAIEQRTLVAATVAGFRELCEQFALKQTIARGIQRLGAGSSKAEGRMRNYVKLAQRLDATLARFKLTGFGKPVDAGGARKAGTSPWAQVASK
jgi:hypothetical protein